MLFGRSHRKGTRRKGQNVPSVMDSKLNKLHMRPIYRQHEASYRPMTKVDVIHNKVELFRSLDYQYP